MSILYCIDAKWAKEKVFKMTLTACHTYNIRMIDE